MRLFSFLGNLLSSTDKVITSTANTVVENVSALEGTGRITKGLVQTGGDASQEMAMERRLEYRKAYASFIAESKAIEEQFSDINWDDMP